MEMRFTSKLSVFVSSFIILGMLLGWLGGEWRFYMLSRQHTEGKLNTLVTSIDQMLIAESIGEEKQMLVLTMQALNINTLSIRSDTGRVSYTIENPIEQRFHYIAQDFQEINLPLIKHPGFHIYIKYADSLISPRNILHFTLASLLLLGLIMGLLLKNSRQLHHQVRGADHLEQRAKTILRGNEGAVARGGVHEWPPAASSALDHMLYQLQEARQDRSKLDMLIRSFAAHDAKTGLNNRLFFDNQLTTRLEIEGEHGVVMMVRLPDFDLSGDSYDIEQDQRYSLVNLLSTFLIRYPMALLARYFNSDFTVLLPHRSVKEVEALAAQLVKTADALPASERFDRQAFLHIGITAYRGLQSTEQVIDQVEKATRHAALQGDNNWYVYDTQLPERGRGSVKWRTLLEQVLARGGPRLYQKPALTVAGLVHHREIIPRIFDGDQELLPSEYMPLVQQFGLAESYDRQFIKRIIPMLSFWPEEIFAVPVSIDALLQRSFQRWLRDTLLERPKRHRQQLIVELSEADLCQHIERLSPIVRMLSGLGCRLAVSQAGLTVVNTTYFRSLPIELMKLHPGLVRSIDRRIENQLIVQNLTISTEGKYGMIFAAGVRSHSEWQTLKEKGVHGGLGDFFAAAELMEFQRKKYSRRYRV